MNNNRRWELCIKSQNGTGVVTFVTCSSKEIEDKSNLLRKTIPEVYIMYSEIDAAGSYIGSSSFHSPESRALKDHAQEVLDNILIQDFGSFSGSGSIY